MLTPGSGPQIDGQWIDYYALLDVPINADEDTIRRRIGKVYADAASNSEHRNAMRRDYYRSLVERVLPQCRRVLLDSEWRARYDHQHFLHREKDGAAQSYVEFIGSMRRESNSGLNEALLPQREQDELKAARQVVETALSGAELELLPSETVTNAMAIATPAESAAGTPESEFGAMPTVECVPAPQEKTPRLSERAAATSSHGAGHDVQRGAAPPKIVAQIQPSNQVALESAPNSNTNPTPTITPNVAPTETTTTQPPTAEAEVSPQPGKEARATVITAQEAADIRRRRASNPDHEPFVGPNSRDSRDVNGRKKSRSRVVVEVDDPALKRVLSPTSLNLMVAITGVLLTITIQRFAGTPAVATSIGRTPIVLAVAPELQNALESASATWQKTPAGANYDIVVQSVSSPIALQRALGKSDEQIDGWIPANASYAQRYNELAPAAKRPPLQIGDSLAQTPMVLVARSDQAGGLRTAFPNHKVGTWTALRKVVMQDARGRFGLSDPRQSLTGSVARFSMAREWAETNNQSVAAAVKAPNFWKWMNGFEENVPSGAVSPDAMVKDMVLGTTGRYFWAISYESDALNWISQGKALELFYLPRTALADHPFCAVERVGAPLDVAAGRAAFLDYLKSDAAQKALLQSGFRPTEISPSTVVEENPFTAPRARAQGVQLQGLPRDERFNVVDLSVLQTQWSQYHG